MGMDEFETVCKLLVCRIHNGRLGPDDKSAAIDISDVRVIWLCMTLNSMKTMMTADPDCRRIYELTYEDKNNEIHIATYNMTGNKTVTIR